MPQTTRIEGRCVFVLHIPGGVLYPGVVGAVHHASRDADDVVDDDNI